MWRWRLAGGFLLLNAVQTRPRDASATWLASPHKMYNSRSKKFLNVNR
jgi:hypothetical protein